MLGRRGTGRADAPSLSDRAKALEPDNEHAQTIIDAYYQRSVSATDAARTRALASFTITAAVAAVVLAALAGSMKASASVLVLMLFCMSAMAWFAAAGFFVAATSGSSTAAVPRNQGLTDQQRAGRLLAELEGERHFRDHWLAAANRTAGGAVLASVLTGVTLFLQHRNPPWLPVNVVLTDSAGAAVADVCGQPVPPLRWSVRADTLDEDVLALRRSNCGDRELRLARDDAPVVATAPR